MADKAVEELRRRIDEATDLLRKHENPGRNTEVTDDDPPAKTDEPEPPVVAAEEVERAREREETIGERQANYIGDVEDISGATIGDNLRAATEEDFGTQYDREQSGEDKLWFTRNELYTFVDEEYERDGRF